MKTLKIKSIKTVVLGIALVLLTLTACSKDDELLMPNKSGEVNLLKSGVPPAISAYATTHFPASILKKAVKETEDHMVTYEVELSDYVDLEFNDNFQITKVDGVSKLPNSVIPQPILDYVTENYPNNFITDWEIEDTYQEVELDNGIELKFTLDGVFIRTDSDQDDEQNNEVPLSKANTPTAIKDYVNTHFPQDSILKVIKETDDSVVTYEVFLSENTKLEFDAEYSIISIDAVKKLPDSVIPAAIRDYVNSKYPNNFITDWELEPAHQEVELDNGIELEFTLDGVFIRIDKDKNDDQENDESTGSNGTTVNGIQNYVNTHFPSNTIIKTEKDIDDGAVTYEVALSGNIELEFDADYNITSIDANKKLPDSVIPQAIRTYVNGKYPNNFITDWELDDNRQKVELNNGVELEFSMNGQFIQADND